MPIVSFVNKADLQLLWYQSGAAVPVWLRALAWVYRGLVRVRRGLYRWGWLKRYRAPVPVIVVGNITVGGAGKTPCVIWLCEILRAAGYTPGVVSRGYGGQAASWPQVVTLTSDTRQVGDEPVLIAVRTGCPVFAAPDRGAAIRALLEAEPEVDVIVSDDGLQHYAMARDVEIVVIDGARRFGNGYCLPAGPLREPLSRLGEVDFKVCNGGVAHTGELSMQLAMDQAHNLLRPDWLCSLSELAGTRVHAVAGIGHPQRFFSQLREAGLDVIEHPFPDHHPFRAADIYFDDSLPVLMTEKDAVKCMPFADIQHWAVPVFAKMDAQFARNIVKRLGQ